MIADQHSNIVETNHDRAYYRLNLGDTVIDVTMETRGPDHVETPMRARSESGYEHSRVQ